MISIFSPFHFLWRRIWAVLERRLAPIDHRFDAAEARLDAIEHRLRQIDSRNDGLESRLEPFEEHFPPVVSAVETLGRIVGTLEPTVGTLNQVVGTLEEASFNTGHTLRAVSSRIVPTAGLAVHTTAPRDLQASIIIATDTRAEALDNLLCCLQFLDGPDFEVILVRGPNEGPVTDVLAKWADAVKIVHTGERNTSRARNVGIAEASGNIIALIDDDALPQSDWLLQIMRAFEDGDVGVAGGLVVDTIGVQPQSTPYLSMDRLGNYDARSAEPIDHLNFPLSFKIPYVPGVNSAFRRDALQIVGAFDEEYEYYYDEVDVCCRLIDAGWKIRQLPEAVVYHKLLPSHIRTAARVNARRYSSLKGKLYFSLINNHGHYPISLAIKDMQAFVKRHEIDLQGNARDGYVGERELTQFAIDSERAWSVGLERGLSRQRRLLNMSALNAPSSAFRRFPRVLPADGRKTFVSAASADHDEIAMAAWVPLAKQGHHVHLVITSSDVDTITFDQGVWVHRSCEPIIALHAITERTHAGIVYLVGDIGNGSLADEFDRQFGPTVQFNNLASGEFLPSAFAASDYII